MAKKELPPVKEWEKIRVAPDVMRSVVSRTKTTGLKPQQQINHDLRRIYLSKKTK